MKGLKFAGLSILFTLLAACGGSGGGAGNTVASDTEGASEQPTIAGVVNKGIVAGALVHAIPDSDLNLGIIASTITDNNGAFELVIPDEFVGKSLMLAVQAQEGARMKCDLLDGCDFDGDTSTIDDRFGFGEWMPLHQLFQLVAIVPAAGHSVTTNITPLTHMAAMLVMNQNFEDAAVLQQAIAAANQQVADLFGFAQDITTIPAIDVTDVNAFAHLDDHLESAFRYAAINAGLVSAVQKDFHATDSVIRIDHTYWALGDYFRFHGMPLNTVDDAYTGLDEIYREAQRVTMHLKNQMQEQGLLNQHQLLFALSGVYSDLGFDATLYEQSEPSDGGGQGVVLNPENRSNYQKVKDFVEELRELGVAIDSSIIEDGSGNAIDSVGNVLNGFQAQLDAAEMVSSQDAEFAYKALARSLEAMLKVYEINNPDLSEVTIEQGFYQILGDNYIDSVIVRVDVDEQGLRTFVVDGDVTVTKNGETRDIPVDLQLTLHALQLAVSGYASDDVTIFDNEWKQPEYVNNETHSGVIDLFFSGAVDSGSVQLNMTKGTAKALYTGVVREEVNVWDYSNGSSAESILLHQSEWTISQLLIDLGASVEQVSSGQIANPIKFEGRVQLSLSDFVFFKDKSNGYYEYPEWGGDVYSNELWVNEFSDVSLALTGRASNQTGEAFLLDLSLSLDDTKLNDWVFWLDRCHKIYCGPYDDYNLEVNGSANEYLGINASLRFSAQLAGISDVLVVDFDLQTYSQYMAEVDLKLSYPGRQIRVHGTMDYDYLLYRDMYGEMYYVGDLFVENLNDGVQIKVGLDTATEPGQEVFDVAMRMDSNEDGVIDDQDFLYGWYEQRNGVDLLIFQDDKQLGQTEFQSLF